MLAIIDDAAVITDAKTTVKALSFLTGRVTTHNDTIANTNNNNNNDNGDDNSNDDTDNYDDCILVAIGGMISIMCYTRHDGGKEEYEAVSSFCQALSPSNWYVVEENIINRNQPPILLTITRVR